jgi:hypothetical protein
MLFMKRQKASEGFCSSKGQNGDLRFLAFNCFCFFFFFLSLRAG